MTRTHITRTLPKNVTAQAGRLYFNARCKGVRYCAPFNMPDSNECRRRAGLTAQQIVAAMKLGTFDPNDYPLLQRFHTDSSTGNYPAFERYADIWLDKKSVLAPATFRTYRNLINKHLIPHFGSMPINEITKPVVEKWLTGIVKTISRTYANECLRRLKSILYDAEADYDLSLRLNRVKSLRCYDAVNSDKDAIFSFEEASTLYYVMGRRLRTMMLCSMFAGLRTGEVIALKREDVDFNQNRLHVRATMSEGERKAPKTRAGIRAIAVHPVLRAALAEQLASHDHEFVFITRRGKPFWHRQNFEREYISAKERAKVRDLRWYAFRKMFASMRYACNGFVPGAVARDMGHTDVATSLNKYGEVMPHMGCKFEEVAFPLEPEFLKPVADGVQA